MAAPPPSPLFDPTFLRQLQGLRIRASRVPAGGRPAEQRSAAKGGGVEFLDVRRYAAGDDLRTLDWHLLQRLDQLFVRVHRREEDLPVHIVLDLSTSMTRNAGAGASAQGPDRDSTARRAAAGLAWIALQSHDKVRIHTVPGEHAPTRAIAGGARGFHGMLRWLGELPRGGGTDLIDGIRKLAATHRRRGLCVVLSDFLDPAGPDAVLAALGKLQHKLLLLRIVVPGEQEPTLRGAVELVDCEAPGRSLVLQMDDSTAARHREAWQAYQDRLHQLARRRGGMCAQLHCDQPVPLQLASLFRDGELVA